MINKAQLVELLVDWQQSLTPEYFKESEKLCSEDFIVVPFRKAEEFGVLDEFEESIDNDHISVEKLPNKSQLIELLVEWQKSLTPEYFEETWKLNQEDLLDVPFKKAEELGILKDFKKRLEFRGYKTYNKYLNENVEGDNGFMGIKPKKK